MKITSKGYLLCPLLELANRFFLESGWTVSPTLIYCNVQLSVLFGEVGQTFDRCAVFSEKPLEKQIISCF